MKISGFGELENLRKAAMQEGTKAPAQNADLSGATPPAVESGDQVQLSSGAKIISKLDDVPDVRQALLDNIKSEIDSGVYTNTERLNSAVRNLLENI